MTSLSATIGTGNIAGVATAIFLGGPGAVFWMWMTAMATKSEPFRCETGNFVGGPIMFGLAITFALFAGIRFRHRRSAAMNTNFWHRD